ncbi:hypothetical protein KUTeg_010074 [Tegillarca granosa]|uniref:Large ribosomal subunit protein P2 n=1 Tax=Tegillarca granosa TaxID=220873 RepID=A0ABQ9F900_TEGGR|nr:hypothetical protein KUTeg_010074 [Tegillarca granosa]
MRYVAAYMLAVMGGNSNPTARDIEKIVGSVGIECETDKLAIVLKELKGKDLEELIKKGQEKLANAPGAGAVITTTTDTKAAVEDKAEETKEVKNEEPESSSDDDMGFGLFDD